MSRRKLAVSHRTTRSLRVATPAQHDKVSKVVKDNRVVVTGPGVALLSK